MLKQSDIKKEIDCILVPKVFFTEKYKYLNTVTKIMYCFLMDRMKYEGNPVVYPIKEMASILNISHSTVIRYYKQLELNEFIHIQRRGLNKPNLIYLKKHFHDEI